MSMKTHLSEMEALATKLRNGGAELESVGTPPSAPQVGLATQAVAGALAMLACSAAGISEGLVIVGDAVQESRSVYGETEQANTDTLNNAGPR